MEKPEPWKETTGLPKSGTILQVPIAIYVTKSQERPETELNDQKLNSRTLTYPTHIP